MISPKNLLQGVSYSYRVQENITWHSFSTSLAWQKEQIPKSQFFIHKNIECLLHELHETIKLHEFASCSGPG